VITFDCKVPGSISIVWVGIVALLHLGPAYAALAQTACRSDFTKGQLCSYISVRPATAERLAEKSTFAVLAERNTARVVEDIQSRFLAVPFTARGTQMIMIQYTPK
jgi:hypothetical protein